MPIFTFRCECGTEFDELVMRRSDDDDDVSCPECGSNTLRRVFSRGTTFILKGGGWFADGYSSRD